MRIVVIALSTFLVAVPAFAAVPAVREQGTLVLDGIPEIAADALPTLRAKITPYLSARSAFFQDWLDDGSMLITTRFGTAYQVHRVAMPLGDRTQLTFGDDAIDAVAGVPQQPAFAFSRDAGGNERYAVYLQPTAGGLPRLVSEPDTRNESIVFSRDGVLMAWSRATPGSPNYDIMTMDPRRNAPARIAFKGTGALSPVDISNDHRLVLIDQAVSDTVNHRYVLDLRTNALRRIGGKTDANYLGGKFTPDGKAVILLSDLGKEFIHLVRIDLGSDAVTVLNPADQWDVEAFDVSPDGKTIAYSLDEDGISRVVIRDAVTGAPLPSPPLPRGVLIALKFSPDGKSLAVNLTSPKVARDMWAWSLDTHKLVRWTQSELGGLNPDNLHDADLIHFASFDGKQIPAFAYGRVAGEKRPVILYVHGGPDAQDRPEFFATFQYWMNEVGAVVIAPNIRGSTGYGRSYTEADNGDRREIIYKDISALLDWVAQQPDLDPHRVVIYGGSAAGLSQGWRRDLRRPEYGDERDPQMRAFQMRMSPLGMADKIASPLLVIQGANDPRAPKSQADQIVAKVRASGHEAWYLWAKDEGHGFHKAANIEAQRLVETMFFRHVFAGH